MSTAEAIHLVRVYDRTDPGPGARFLVERLWPRGIKKTELQVDRWLEDVAPSTALRRWFGHDPDRWTEFRRRYWRELAAHPEAWQPIVEALKRGPVTFLFSSRDREHNNAVALQQYLARRQPFRPQPPSGTGRGTALCTRRDSAVE
ncbi:MAG TPA: DUF488 family protein [Myxococcales bacterium]|nr:DUF488 family protein [Myxococcales bacterium]